MNRWQAAAEKAMTSLWGTAVKCTIADTLRDDGRNRVYRLAVKGGPVTSVILKACLGNKQNPYVVGDDLPGHAFRRFCNEWAGCAMLAPLGLGPIAYTGDTKRGFYIMEDLGAGTSLADRLTGDNSTAATAALLAYAHTLGELHAATQGQEARWNELRRARGGSGHGNGGADSWRKDMTDFRGVCERHAITLPSGLDAELLQITECLDNPGSYRVFTPTDCCPDNHFVRGNRVVFFDCEGATMRHALLDAAYFLVPFPTCWCNSRLPTGMPDRLIGAYREHFPGQADFDEQLTLACTSWIFPALTRELGARWDLEDQKWGLATHRQRHLHRLENLLARSNFAALLPRLAALTQDIFGMLKTRWIDVEPMPLYFAFRNKGDLSRV